ncbi:MAG: membrane protein insertase YidC [Desulfobacteraceae bacterium]|nr:membrane protein insertase YidC [Desulfobacteraceae bacterium]
MEQKRLLLAIGLSFLVLFGWNYFFAPAPEELEKLKKQEQKHAQEQKQGEVNQSSSDTSVKDNETAPIFKTQDKLIESRQARTLTIETPLYKIKLSEQGASVISMILKNYREGVNKESEYKQLIDQKLDNGSFLLTGSGQTGKELETRLYELDRATDYITIGKNSETIRFRTVTTNGIQVEKAYTFLPDTYLVHLDVSVYNQSGQSFKEKVGLSVKQIKENQKQAYGFEGPAGLINGQLEQIDIDDIEDYEILEGDIRWVSIETRYFMTSIIVPENTQGGMELAYQEKKLSSKLLLKNDNLDPGEKKNFKASIFIGPKSHSILKGLNNELERAVNFGMFDVIAKPCLWFMNFIYKFIPNYGIAIIILTIFTRLIFWPLAAKSYKSMGEMRKVQPLMQEIREKYKNDRAKMNQEMMSLYRTYKINPMGGCLPMLIQLPVFFALYRMLYQAIELRHAPFFGWINDLSAPDRLFHFGIDIPFMDSPEGIPVLTLIMGATMFLQQKMTPTSGDPTQAKMMMLMPVVFTFIFINFSSGLVLYWLVSNLLSILQQYYTNKKTA